MVIDRSSWLKAIANPFTNSLLTTFLNCKDLKIYKAAIKSKDLVVAQHYLETCILSIEKHRPVSIMGDLKFEHMRDLSKIGKSLAENEKA